MKSGLWNLEKLGLNLKKCCRKRNKNISKKWKNVNYFLFLLHEPLGVKLCFLITKIKDRRKKKEKKKKCLKKSSMWFFWRDSTPFLVCLFPLNEVPKKIKKRNFLCGICIKGQFIQRRWGKSKNKQYQTVAWQDENTWKPKKTGLSKKQVRQQAQRSFFFRHFLLFFLRPILSVLSVVLFFPLFSSFFFDCF